MIKKLLILILLFGCTQPKELIKPEMAKVDSFNIGSDYLDTVYISVNSKYIVINGKEYLAKDTMFTNVINDYVKDCYKDTAMFSYTDRPTSDPKLNTRTYNYWYPNKPTIKGLKRWLRTQK